jgi:hypothetical protein
MEEQGYCSHRVTKGIMMRKDKIVFQLQTLITFGWLSVANKEPYNEFLTLGFATLVLWNMESTPKKSQPNPVQCPSAFV